MPRIVQGRASLLLAGHQSVKPRDVETGSRYLHGADLTKPCADRGHVFLLGSGPSGRGDAAVTTWIYRVALNTAIDWTRKERRHRHGQQPLDSVAGLLTVSPAVRDPRLDWLYRQIHGLSDVDRSLALLLLDGFSYRDMADIVGISENHVGVRIHRIKAALSAKRPETER
jgi:DNA-directed RNA polymerase specialized sigma24 family protein